MIKVSQSNTISVPVAVDIPVDGGDTVTSIYTAIFRRVPQEEIDAMFERINKRETSDNEIIKDVLVGWGKDVVDEGNAPLEFNPTNVEALMNIYPTRRSTVRKFFEMMNGGAEKNL